MLRGKPLRMRIFEATTADASHMNNQQWIQDLEGTGFLQDLLETLIQRGLGVLPAREVAISMFELILQYHPEWRNSPPPDYELARLLKISPRRLRGYIDDVNFRNQSIDDDVLKQNLRERLTRIEKIKDGEWVVFEIEDGLLHSYAQQKVRENFGVFESGISGTVIKLSSRQYGALCMSILSQEQAEEMLAALTDGQDVQRIQDSQNKPLRYRVLDAFAVSAGAQAGKKMVDLGFMIASGGLSEISSISEVLHLLLDRDDANPSVTV